MDVDDVNDPLGLPPDNSAAKIEELPDDTLIEPVITSKTNAYVIDSSIENTDAEIVNDSMEDIETSLPTRTTHGNVTIEEVDDDVTPGPRMTGTTLDEFSQEFVSFFYRTLNSFWRLGLACNEGAMWKMKQSFNEYAYFTLEGTQITGSHHTVVALSQWLVRDADRSVDRAHILRLKPFGVSSAAFGGDMIHLSCTGKIEAVPSQPRVADADSDEMADESLDSISLRGFFSQIFILVRRSTDSRWMIAHSILRSLSETPS